MSLNQNLRITKKEFDFLAQSERFWYALHMQVETQSKKRLSGVQVK